MMRSVILTMKPHYILMHNVTKLLPALQ